MYAVIEQGGKQYKVSEGDVIQIDLLEIDPQAKNVDFDKVLMVSDGENISVGAPYIDGAKVSGVFENTAEDATVKGPKLYPTHFRRRKDSRKRIGHRQKYLKVKVDKISA